MTSIAEAWGGSAFSEPIVNDIQPMPAKAAATAPSERDLRSLVRRYLDKQYDTYGPEGVAALMRPDTVTGLRNYAVSNWLYWTDSDVAITLVVIAVVVFLLE